MVLGESISSEEYLSPFRFPLLLLGHSSSWVMSNDSYGLSAISVFWTHLLLRHGCRFISYRSQQSQLRLKLSDVSKNQHTAHGTRNVPLNEKAFNIILQPNELQELK